MVARAAEREVGPEFGRLHAAEVFAAEGLAAMPLHEVEIAADVVAVGAHGARRGAAFVFQVGEPVPEGLAGGQRTGP